MPDEEGAPGPAARRERAKKLSFRRNSSKEEDDESVPAPPLSQSAPPGRRRAILHNMMRHRGGHRDAVRPVPPVELMDELEMGLLPVAMLKMYMERDERSQPRVPVLLQNVAFKVTDTILTPHSGHTLYRIEINYGQGMLQWAIYREIRDFVALHTYFRTLTVRSVLGKSSKNRGEGDSALPAFPKWTLSGLLALKGNSRKQSTNTDPQAKAGSDKDTREALEVYLVRLTQSVLFLPQVNRLCRFLELSLLAIQMANMQGELGKQGYLKIKSRSSRKESLTLASLSENGRPPKWFIVRESYIVIVEHLHSLQIYDVFLMDQDFEVQQDRHVRHNLVEYGPGEKTKSTPQGAEDDPERTGATVHHYVKRHTFQLLNAERKLKVAARSEREMEQFLMSMKWAAGRNQFGQPNRFDSFAPIRRKVSAQWLVDGRDYYWALSEAISHARERIYIHDWWLSPELHLRRPGTKEWRLDRLLQRKAAEGVHIYVILYNEVSNQFTPTDSGYAKQRLMALHPNIYVQRSPSHFQTGTFYWAHHEKMCVIDEMVAFMGGFDLCYGRWDTSTHALVDDALYPDPDAKLAYDADFIGPVIDGAEAHIWPGQDYANERVAEWHTLSKPSLDIIPRDKTPRMPWHDTGVQIFGQPARDLCRHFGQRWNMLLRHKKHTRKMPFLLPPPDLTPAEVAQYGVEGPCEVQICRSAGPWSLNTHKKVEHSIQNAYLKTIQLSEHFIYIENQFFITSTAMDGVEIENHIGLALVERIVRAHREDTAWRAIVMIPLTPGFPMAYDHPESGSVRLIQMMQYLSISRGPNSVFGRLRKAGVNPDDYISFFSLRGWGQLRQGQLTSEQVYIHGKMLVADDRVAIIGSANINERSQRGDRDSELACVIRDTDMLDSTMAGEPYKVGRFAHTLRMRMMREHLGIDNDELAQTVLGRDRGPPATADEETPSHHDADPGQPKRRGLRGAWEPPFTPPTVTADAFVDPLLPEFFEDVWMAGAEYNTAVFRQVFQCVPDDQTKTWSAYKQSKNWHNRLARSFWRVPRTVDEAADAQAAGVTDVPESDAFSRRELEQMMTLLHTCRGHLVQHPLQFLEQEVDAGNFLFPLDQINPLSIFS